VQAAIHTFRRDFRLFYNGTEGLHSKLCPLTILEAAIEFVVRQREHRRMRTFQEEYRAMLELHDIKFDERYVWG
jgi:hypothetical protein